LPEGVSRKLRLGIAGLGRAFSVMLPTFQRDPRVSLVAAADPRPEARTRFEVDIGGRTYETVAALCEDAAVEVLYVATPHQFHAEHACLGASAGKHLLIEKPMCLSLAEATEIIEAARHARVHVLVGHSHSYDAPILKTRKLIESGVYGAVRMITAVNYTDFLYRPRRPEELDTSRGGGALLNQAPHQVDIVRLLGGGCVASVRAQTGAWDHMRPTEGAYAALLNFTNGAYASLAYSGYGHFDSDEWQNWTGEMGQTKSARPFARRHFASAEEELAAKNAGNYGGSGWEAPAPQSLLHQHFGTIIVSCDRADLRPSPAGVMIYDDKGMQFDALLPPAVPRGEVINELYAAVIEGETSPLHNGQWGRATLEVCLAMLQSAHEGKDIALTYQVPVG
jgi:phthalate 4,5-cis-dihydrodiol dehydrogenase